MRSVIQPGLALSHISGPPGTLGAYGLNADGKVVIISAEHTITNLWTAKLGDPIKVYADTSRGDGIVFLTRIRGIQESLPTVLKSPIQVSEGMRIVKSGFRTGVTFGTIEAGDHEISVEYRDGTKKRYDNMGVASIQSDHGDSGALILKADTLEPVGIIESKDNAYPELTYFFKLTDMPHYRGVFCPLSVPENSNDQSNDVLESIVPDALFSQKRPMNARARAQRSSIPYYFQE